MPKSRDEIVEVADKYMVIYQDGGWRVFGLFDSLPEALEANYKWVPRAARSHVYAVFEVAGRKR